MLFKGKNAYLSNMFECPIVWKGIEFKSSETLFQMFKCADTKDMQRFVTLNGYQAKKLGRQIKMRSDWNEVKEQYMRYVLDMKFTQNPQLAKQLIAEQQPIVEENTWGDTYWGVCNGRGMNRLGVILEEVRKSLENKPL